MASGASQQSLDRQPVSTPPSPPNALARGSAKSGQAGRSVNRIRCDLLSQPTEDLLDQKPTDDRSRVLIISAHPDDSEFGSAGSVGVWAAEGKEVYYLVCTRGDKGSEDPNMTSERLARIREDEQRNAVAAAGGRGVNFLDFKDGELTPSYQFREAIVREIRGVRPFTVVTHDPTVVYSDQSINHPDHRAVGTAVLDSIYPTARDRLNFLQHEVEGLGSHKVKEVLLWGALEPNYWVDIAKTFDKKIAALSEHKSQFKDFDKLRERLSERARDVGAPQGMAMAEAFRRIDMDR